MFVFDKKKRRKKEHYLETKRNKKFPNISRRLKEIKIRQKVNHYLN